MSSRRTDTSSKRKRTTPQKLKSRKLFAASKHDMREVLHMSRDEDEQCLSGHNRENVPKPLHKKKIRSETQPKNDNITETPQNKENMPEKYPSEAGTAHRSRGRPKGSKNKTFPTHPTRVYAVREGKSLIYSEKTRDGNAKPQNGAGTPSRGRGRPKGTTKVKQIDEDAPKRSRGRPKGSKNRKPSKGKLSRGRPRKIAAAAGDPETPKQSRGRPKGSLNKIPSARKLALLASMHEEKKRGRPKKMILDGAVVMSLTPKRPRGRPKSTGGYVHVPSVEMESSASNMQDDDDDEDEDEDNGDFE